MSLSEERRTVGLDIREGLLEVLERRGLLERRQNFGGFGVARGVHFSFLFFSGKFRIISEKTVSFSSWNLFRGLVVSDREEGNRKEFIRRRQARIWKYGLDGWVGPLNKII